MTNDRPLVSIEKSWEVAQQKANSLHVVVVGKIKGFLDPEVLRRSLLLVKSIASPFKVREKIFDFVFQPNVSIGDTDN